MICPECEGRRTVTAILCGPDGSRRMTTPCYRCNGTGALPERQRAWIELGRELRAQRIARHQSMLERARQLGIEVAEVSAMEQGRLDPLRLCDA